MHRTTCTFERGALCEVSEPERGEEGSLARTRPAWRGTQAGGRGQPHGGAAGQEKSEPGGDGGNE